MLSFLVLIEDGDRYWAVTRPCGRVAAASVAHFKSEAIKRYVESPHTQDKPWKFFRAHGCRVVKNTIQIQLNDEPMRGATGTNLK